MSFWMTPNEKAELRSLVHPVVIVDTPQLLEISFQIGDEPFAMSYRSSDDDEDVATGASNPLFDLRLAELALRNTQDLIRIALYVATTNQDPLKTSLVRQRQ